MDNGDSKFMRILKRIEPSICAIGIFITVISVVINVGADFIFNKRFTVAEEFASFGYIWVTFAGLGYLYRVDSFMEVSFVLKAMKSKHRYLAEFIRLIYLLFFSAMLIYATAILLKGSFVKKMVASQIPYFFLDISVLIGFASLFGHVAVDIVKWFKNFSRMMKTPEKPWPEGGIRMFLNGKEDEQI